MQIEIDEPEFSAVCMSKDQTPGAISFMAAAANYANNAPKKKISRSIINEKHRKHKKIMTESIRAKTCESFKSGPVFMMS